MVLGRGAVVGVRMPGVGAPDVEDAPMATRAPEVRVHAPGRLAEAVAQEFLRQIASRYGRHAVRAARVQHPGAGPWCVDVAVAGVPLPVRISTARRSGPTPGRAVQPGVAEVWISPDGRCCAREAGQADGQWVPLEPAMGWPV
ncbi:hypothetical protein EDF46_0648 [Frondihabitans sp. PhB188]|nr:hypothetical protein EDF46_0648 [Frondihabitans sp. PhB188]